MPTAEHAGLSALIADKFFREAKLAGTASVHCFISINHTGEVETMPIFERIWREFPNVRTFAPRINEQTGNIDSLPFRAETVLLENRWKIAEPSDGPVADPPEMDIVIVPLLCFDLDGFRVGYGKGFYDRFLAECRPDCLKIGLSFFPPVDRIDGLHDGDMALDVFITPEKTYRRDAKTQRLG